MTTRRILAAYRALSPAQRHEGGLWFWRAHCLAREIADETSVPVDHVCGVIARLSPATEWGHNVDVARSVCAAIEPDHYRGYGPNLTRAKLIVAEGWSVPPSGPKISAFYDNLLRPHESQEVTIDRHILRWGQLPVDKPPHNAYYERLARPWRRAAKIADVLPHQLQASIWESVRAPTNLSTVPF